ncbi:MAG TPA: hypothetical protein VJB63_03475 [Patescibacteria group bacterium]|nr:hypothetical protein [Patescibacteria group bacterium]
MDIQSNQAVSSSTSVLIKESTKKHNKYFYHIIGFVILLFLLIGVYFFSKNELFSPYQQFSPSTINRPLPPITNPPSDNNLFTGTVKKLDQDLGLIILTEEEKLNNDNPKVFYYEAGTYTQGKYKGYIRYVALREPNDPSGWGVYIFASKDQETYIFDDANIEPYNADPLYEINNSKISKIDRLDSDHASIIALNERFSLNKNELLADGDNLIMDFTQYKALRSTNQKLVFYMTAYDKPVKVEDEDQYIDGRTGVIVVDSTGLSFSYDEANPQKTESYIKARDRYKKEYADYLQYLKSTSTEKPQNALSSPDYPQRPSLRLTKQEIQTQDRLYDTYDLALPGGCAVDTNTLLVKNISDQELQKIGNSSYGELYILIDKNHPLYKAQFDTKTRMDEEIFIAVNERKKPSYDEYISKNPLIFFKDYWGRWVVLGEYDFKLEGGCGKPVVYFYPVEPTRVHAQFTVPIHFDVSIPTYHDGWDVLAYPNGTLIDLQTQYTNCKDIDSARKGSEYAQYACKNNSYPYLYWAGQSLNSTYPEPTQGWIVQKNNVENFMNQTLDQIGFTRKEKVDMMSYWLPEMMQKDAPYYRIAFLQTADMNKIIPMHITPQPKSIYRLFLDYLPLQSKPSYTLKPQNLPHVVREGFTMLEWGGLKR